MPDPTGTPATPEPTPQQAGETPASWEDFLNGQPEEIKVLYTTHSAGLLNTVKSTRKERDDLARDLKSAAAKMEEGSAARTQLEQVSSRLEMAEKRASFLEDAMRPEVQCKNPKAAWLLAQAGDLFDKQGRPDWTTIKTEAPELFGAPTANANAGNGTQQTKLPPHDSMNAFIRAGRG